MNARKQGGGTRLRGGEAGAEMLEVAVMVAIGAVLAGVVMGFVTGTLAPGLKLSQYSYYHTLYGSQTAPVDPLGDA